MSSSRGTTRRKPKRGRGGSANRTTLAVLAIVGAVIVLTVVIWFVLRGTPPFSGDPMASVESTLRALARQHGVGDDDLEADVEIRKIDGVFVRSWKIRFPNTASREEFVAEVSILGDRDDVTVGSPATRVGGAMSVRVDHGIEAFELELTVSRPAGSYGRASRVAETPRPPATATPRPQPPADARGRLAIILDDAGQSMDLVPRIGELPTEVGIAILPFLPFSTETALEVHEAGHEVWLHLPMEAMGNEDPGPGALMVDMGSDEIRDTVFMAINNLPHVVGINNHMGSKATADLRLMTWVMQELSAMELAFIDSRTTVDTVAEEAARAQGVKTGRRHVFLDNQRDAGSIREQLDEAVYRSRLEGEIIAIGHLTEVTVQVLADELPRLGERGAELVRPTELLD
jgi:polysaccharide deacetylase 2 family uncharacterized protein YibQ